MLNILCQMIPS